MRTYTFKVVVEPDEEALKNINEVVQMIVDELREEEIPLPEASGDDVEVFEGTRVAVTV